MSKNADRNLLIRCEGRCYHVVIYGPKKTDTFTGVYHIFVQTVIMEEHRIILRECIYFRWQGRLGPRNRAGEGFKNIFVMVVLQVCVLLANLNNF